MLKKKYICIFMLLFFLCSSVIVSAGPDIETLIEEAPIQEDYPDAGAVILNNEITADYTGEEYFIEVFQVIKVFNERGIDRFGERDIRFNEEREEIKIHKAKTITPEGEEVEVKEDAINIITPPELSQVNIYSDVRDKVLNMPALEEGSIIIINYKREIKEPIMEDEFWLSAGFQDREPMENISLKVKTPLDKEIQYKNERMEISPEITEKDNVRIYEWQQEKVEPVITESGMPPLRNIFSYVNISSLDSWEKISSWYQKLSEDRIDKDDNLKEKVEELIADTEDIEEKIKNIFNFVALDIRYVGLEFGDGSYVPYNATEVLANKYGDCKDKSFLLIAMLEEIGVEAEPVLINMYYYPDLEIVSMGHFNHMIVYLPEQDLYLDPTDDLSLYGDLLYVNQGKEVFLPFKSELKETPVYSSQDNNETFNYDVELDEEGNAKVEIEWLSTGYYSSVNKNLFRQFNQQQREMVLNQILSNAFTSFDLIDYEIKGVSDLEVPFSLSAVVKVNNFARSLGDQLSIRPFRIGMHLSQIAPTETRNYPLYTGFKFNFKRSINIKVPEGFDVEYLPENKKIEKNVGSVHVEYEEKEDVIEILLDFTVDRVQIEVDEYNQLKDLIVEAQNIIQEQIIIK